MSEYHTEEALSRSQKAQEDKVQILTELDRAQEEVAKVNEDKAALEGKVLKLVQEVRTTQSEVASRDQQVNVMLRGRRTDKEEMEVLEGKVLILQVDCDRMNRGKKKKAEKDALAMVSAMVNFRAAMWYWLGVKPALATWVANRRTASSTECLLARVALLDTQRDLQISQEELATSQKERGLLEARVLQLFVLLEEAKATQPSPVDLEDPPSEMTSSGHFKQVSGLEKELAEAKEEIILLNETMEEAETELERLGQAVTDVNRKLSIHVTRHVISQLPQKTLGRAFTRFCENALEARSNDTLALREANRSLQGELIELCERWEQREATVASMLEKQIHLGREAAVVGRLPVPANPSGHRSNQVGTPRRKRASLPTSWEEEEEGEQGRGSHEKVQATMVKKKTPDTAEYDAMRAELRRRTEQAAEAEKLAQEEEDLRYFEEELIRLEKENAILLKEVGRLKSHLKDAREELRAVQGGMLAAKMEHVGKKRPQTVKRPARRVYHPPLDMP